MSPPECPERLVSEKRMEALPAARDWPPGAGAFCQGQFQWGKNIYSVAEGERQEDNKGHLCVLTLCEQQVSQKTDCQGTRYSHWSPTFHQIVKTLIHCKVEQHHSEWNMAGDKPEIYL